MPVRNGSAGRNPAAVGNDEHRFCVGRPASIGATNNSSLPDATTARSGDGTSSAEGLLGQRTGKVVALEAFALDGAAYGGLIGTVEDAARVVALHCNGGIVKGTRLLSTEAVRSMATVTALGKPYDLAMGWFRPHNDRSVHLEHFGGGMGYWNVMRIHPETGYGAIAMSNITRHWNITTLADEAIGLISATRTNTRRPDSG